MRCYFHLVSSHESIPDDIGIEVSDLAKQGASWQGWRLDNVDRSGRVLLSIPLDPTLH
jgi:hypothetical protein